MLIDNELICRFDKNLEKKERHCLVNIHIHKKYIMNYELNKSCLNSKKMDIPYSHPLCRANISTNVRNSEEELKKILLLDDLSISLTFLPIYYVLCHQRLVNPITFTSNKRLH